jgi:hypothetical protein
MAKKAAIQNRRPYPEKHLGVPVGQWRQKKRQEWKLLMNALSTFTYGCAYTPTHQDLYELQKLAVRIEEDLQGNWVAW